MDFHDEQPRKRVRLDSPSAQTPATTTPVHEPIPAATSPALSAPVDAEMADAGLAVQNPDAAVPDPDAALLEREIKAGITAYVNPAAKGFSGVLKQRYTDFLVNEILPSGKVLHLESLDMTVSKPAAAVEGKPEVKEEVKAEPKPEAKPEVEGDEGTAVPEIPLEQVAELQAIFGEENTVSLIKLFGLSWKNPSAKRGSFFTITSPVIEDKEDRTKAHQAVRRILHNKLETVTADDNTITVTKAAPPAKRNGAKWQRNQVGNNRARGKLAWSDLGGEYLHFTLYKENKDTMEVIYYLASQMKLAAKHFSFAGTKDRRAVTVQRVCAFRVEAARLAGLSTNLRNAYIGGFKYEPHGLSLGDLAGNEFRITLRDCTFPGDEGLTSIDALLQHARAIVETAVNSFQNQGFINYYGLQRFGSFSLGTDEVGKRLLNEDLAGAISAILQFSPRALAAAQGEPVAALISSDDRARALGIHTWRTTGRAAEALDLIPRKFTAERNIISHLGLKGRTGDFQGALGNVPRNLRLMYVHAYQSLVWNTVAGRRWEVYGGRVVEGDLVIVGEKDGGVDEPEVDDEGEVIVRPGAEDRATGDADFVRARPLSKDEAESGTWDVFDIVLPLPGWDVVYPANEIGAFYKEFMGSETGGGLDPHNMRRRWKDISLSGGYRKVLARPRERVEWEVKAYGDANEQLVSTDLDAIPGAPRRQEQTVQEGANERIAVVLRMQLGSSQYATMALREMMKAGGVKSYAADYGSGR
ncbi:tRNA pseudouridine synthase D [Trichodelitschia bisporula]|uniref:tRNA pseudouridine synthase D n=1 Tax=Trichodelitschia bisporula TaxID=703511 RepID=A0A6G1HKK9_9PEZI|nr:tRNA pseudouridine synthase D [Trichodelitschia bisporula]